jgi:capsular exopolysaccharide synthesis family protein
MERHHASEPADLRRYLAVLRKRKWTIALVTALVLAGVLFMSFSKTPIYEASARILIQPLSDSQPVDITNEMQVLSSINVGNRVARDVAPDKTGKQLLRGLDVQLIENDSEVLVVRYSSTEPLLAQQAANAFARNYLDYRLENALAVAEQQAGTLQDRIEGVQADLEEATRQLAALPETAEIERARLEAERSQLTARSAVLQTQLESLPQVGLIQSGQVLQQASLPTTATSPNLQSDAILGVLLGLVVGIAAGFLKDRLDYRFRDKDEVAHIMHAPILAMVPKIERPRRRRKDQQLLIMNETKTTASEIFRSLRTNLQFIVSQNQLKSIVVTSSAPREGKTTTAANLGTALAHAGQRVILVSADLRRPNLEKHFGIDRAQGLTTWLMGEVDSPWPLLVKAGVPHMRILPAGPIPSNPSELLSSPRLDALLRLLEEQCDIVIIDSTPALPLADAVILASRADATVFVVNASRTHRSVAAQARAALGRVNANVVGVVLNEVDEGMAPEYSYYYTYEMPETDIRPKRASGQTSTVEPLSRGERPRRGLRR